MALATARATARLFSSANRAIHVRSWSLPFAPGGTLALRLTRPCAVTVYVLDPHVHDWHTAHVHLDVQSDTPGVSVSDGLALRVARALQLSITSSSTLSSSSQPSAPLPDVLCLETLPEPARAAAAAAAAHTAECSNSRVVLRIGVPGRVNLDAELPFSAPTRSAPGASSIDSGAAPSNSSSGSTTVSQQRRHQRRAEYALVTEGTLEGDVRIRTGKGVGVSLEKLKSLHVDIEVEDGDVVAQTVLGNLHVRSGGGRGSVDVGRAQGPVVRIDSAAAGDVQVRAVYADRAELCARGAGAAVRVGAAQGGHTRIRTADGAVEVAGVNGSLRVESDRGDVEARLSDPRQLVDVLARRGNVRIGLPDALRAGVRFEAGRSVVVDSGVAVRQHGPQLDSRRDDYDERVRDGRDSRGGEDHADDIVSIVREDDDAGTRQRGRRTQVVRGFVGDVHSPTPRSIGADQGAEAAVMVHARALEGNLDVTQQSWADAIGLRAAPDGSAGKERFPRWASSDGAIG